VQITQKAVRRARALVFLALLCSADIGGGRCAAQRLSSNSFPAVPFSPLPTPTPVPLEPSSVDKFVDWVSVMPATQVAEATREIARAAGNVAVINAVAGKLSLHRPLAYGRQIIYLSILGETRNDLTVAPLRNYVYSPDCQVFEQLPGGPLATGKSNLTIFDACGGLKSWAISMVAHVNTQVAQAVVLQAIGGHPSRMVRLSAMNSFLYANGDSADAVQRALLAARPNEAKLVGLPRLAPQFSLRDFDARVARYYQEHPEDRPGPVAQKGAHQ
jgi:hypothetical protein